RRIGDLLDAASLEAQRLRLDLQPVDLVALAQAAAEQARGRTSAHTIRVDVPDRPIVGTWDRDRVGQVLANLLSNAIKYSPDGGEILVRVEDLGQEAMVSVTDRGLGIAADQLAKLFDRFYRVRDTAAGVEGLGLGLYITRELIERHGGRI